MEKYSICRPGGFKITDRAISFCKFSEESKIADIGCGYGSTVYHILENYGLNIYGVDKDEHSLNYARSFGKSNLFYLSDASNLPFENGSLDGLLFECSFSKMDNPHLILNECSRVLKTNGLLVISDFYARGKTAQLKGLMGRVDKKENILNQIEQHKFKIELFEDYSEYLFDLWGQMIFDQGLDSIYENIGADTKALKEIKSGYFLSISQKEN